MYFIFPVSDGWTAHLTTAFFWYWFHGFRLFFVGF